MNQESTTLVFPTTWGAIPVTLQDSRVISCSLPQPDTCKPFSLRPIENIPAQAQPAINFLTALFSGQPAPLPEICFPAGTPFQQAVWRAMLEIPRGQVWTYGELAGLIGHPRAARAVGQACRANSLPLFIPCHRVTGANNTLGGFSCGPAWKALLLKLEQVNQTKYR
jgi:O-6-methylguanine DNA methyltransferase